MYEEMSFAQAARQAKRDRLERTHQDIYITTPKGLEVKLQFDGKKDWRAYRHLGGGWEAMNLGSGTVDPLIDYINRRY